MRYTRAQISRLQYFASSRPASDAALIWIFVWIFISCGILWFFAALAFPVYDGAQGVSLSWVGALLATGGLVAAGLCYLLYKYLLAKKKTAINELKVLISEHEPKHH